MKILVGSGERPRPTADQPKIFVIASFDAATGRSDEITTCSVCYPSDRASSDDPNANLRSRRGDSATVPSGHASSAAATARRSRYRGRRWLLQEAVGLVRRKRFLPQRRGLQRRSQILCETFVFLPICRELPASPVVMSVAPSFSPNRIGVCICRRHDVHRWRRIDWIVFDHDWRRCHHHGRRLLDNNGRCSSITVGGGFAISRYCQIGGHRRRGKS